MFNFNHYDIQKALRSTAAGRRSKSRSGIGQIGAARPQNTKPSKRGRRTRSKRDRTAAERKTFKGRPQDRMHQK